ncbi:MAG: hypothetical protein KGN33_16560 [Paracoccaceae bacterium]|nr:hypothetical protein [Paracoccaceae bacterium]
MTNNNEWGSAQFSVQNGSGSPFIITPCGRERWALEALIAAGKKGCTPMEHPGPRWAAYVADLRNMGLQIETIREAHAGPFAGHHARYILRSAVRHVGKGQR